MDELLSEIDNNIYLNMKSLSDVRQKKKILNKMRTQSSISNLKKKFFYSSYIKSPRQNPNKLIAKLNYSNNNVFCFSAEKNRCKILKKFQKKQYSSIPCKTHFSKIITKDELSTSLSTLIKTNTSLFPPNSNNNTLSNLYINQELKNQNLNNSNNTNIINNNYINNNNNYYFKLNFDEDIVKYLSHNFYVKKNFNSNFLEKTRIMRKAKIIKNYCQRQSVSLQEIKNEELNKLDKIEFNHNKNENLFHCYIRTLNQYLNKLSDIKEVENENLSELKLEKFKIIHQIETINDIISNKKEHLNYLKEIKKFLFEVKYGNFISNISKELKKEYGFIVEKEKKPRKYTRKLSFLERMDLNRKKSNIEFLSKKSLKDKKYDFNSNISLPNKKNLPIFNNADEFVSSINKIKDKLLEDMQQYKECKESINICKIDYDKINKDINQDKNKFMPEEKILIDNLNFQKSKNNILNQKFNILKKSILNEKNTLIKIVMKLKNILLKVNSKIIIENKLNVYYWNTIITSKKFSFEDTNEVIEICYYILKILEKLVEDLIEDKNNFKNNPQLKEEYRRVHNDIERQNNIRRYKLQISLAEKKIEERNRKIYEKIKKNRIGSIIKKKIINYGDKMMEENLLKKKISKKMGEIHNNKYDESKNWFSFY